MSKPIQIKNELYEIIREMKKGNATTSFSDVIEELINNKTKNNNLQLTEATINQEGRFAGSKTIANKTILYKIKEWNYSIPKHIY